MSLGYDSLYNLSVNLAFPVTLGSKSEQHVFCLTGLVLNPDPESESEDSEPDGPDDPVIPSPEMDDVKGKSGGVD